MNLDSSKLMLLITQLSSKELKGMGLWLKSPIHNSSQKVLTLYETLHLKFLKKEKPVHLPKILKYLGIIDRTTDDITGKHLQDFKRIASDLTLQIEEYLSWSQFQKDKINKSRLLMDNLLEKQSYKLISNQLNKSKKQLSASPNRDVEYCKHVFSLAEMAFYMDIILRNRNSVNSIEYTINSLETSSLSQLMRYYCAVVNLQNVLNLEKPFPLKEILKTYINNNEDQQYFTVKIYYKLLVLLENGTPEDYYPLKKLLFESITAFENNEIRQFFSFMSNFCSQMVREGKPDFLEERFALYEKGLELGCWTTTIYFSQHNFVQIVQTGLILNKTQWVKQFIEIYQQQLAPQFLTNISLLCQAMVSFHELQYDKAQQQLSQISSVEDFVYMYDIKVLLLKIYYDNGKLNENFDLHPIHHELEAIRVNMKTGSGKKMAEQVRKIYGNFTKILKRILNRKRKQLLGSTIKTSDINALLNDLAAIKPITERRWLEQKIKDLGN